MRTQAGRSTTVTGWVFAVSWLVASHASSVEAQAIAEQKQEVAVMVPPRVEAGIARPMAERAVGVVARALKSDQFSVIEPEQAVAFAESVQAEAGGNQAPEDSDLSQCTTADCAIWYRAVLNAAVGVQMTLFTKVGPASRSNMLDSITLVIVQRGNAQYSGSATVKDGDIEAAALEAYRSAREKQIKGVGPWLTVRGEPQGAQILVDGQTWGPMPHKDSVTPGMHAVIVRKKGYEDFNQSVNVGDHSDSDAVLEVKLKPALEGDAQVGMTPKKGEAKATKPSVWNYVLGGAAIAVGGAYAVGGVLSITRRGEKCGDGSTCEAGAGAGLRIGGGALVVLGGGLLCGLAPIRARIAVDRTAAAVVVERQF